MTEAEKWDKAWDLATFDDPMMPLVNLGSVKDCYHLLFGDDAR